ncbi:hypothetical protein [Methanolobus psychrotolerans]|uniref:hypothetical protein n=1 Tax=Methanolobus psychrotolerans TaxID=1874706 RepID=UPI000B918CFC|nr:hypothetical protein [Methanolobus psychrotolerans]
MNQEKKRVFHQREKYIGIIRRNRQLLKINILILSAGLALSYLGHESIGEPILWLGIIIFGYTTFSSLMAKKQLKQQV